MLLHVRLLYQKFCMKWTLLGLLCVVQRKMGDTDGSSADSDQSALFGELKITINWLDQPTAPLGILHCCYRICLTHPPSPSMAHPSWIPKTGVAMEAGR